MKVLILSSGEVFPPTSGGSIITYKTAEFLARNGNSVYVVSQYGTREYCEKINQWVVINSKWRFLRTFTAPIGVLRRFYKPFVVYRPLAIIAYYSCDPILESVVRKIKPDILQCEEIYICPIAMHLKIPWIIRKHNVETLRYLDFFTKHLSIGRNNPFLAHALKMLMDKEIQICKSSGKVVTLSQYDERVLKSWGIANAVTVEPGFEMAKTKPSEKPLKKYEINKPYVLFVGSSSPPNVEAGIHILNIARKAVGVCFVIVGDVKRDLEKYSKPRNVRFTGKISLVELHSIYYYADMVLVPITWGSGVQVKFLEALKYGKPIITTSVVTKPFPDLKEEGSVVIEDDLNKYHELIKNIIKNEEAKGNLSRKAKEYSSRFSWEKHAKMLEKIYLKTLEEFIAKS